MRIGIDFDDVVTDSMQTIVDLHNRQYGTSFKREEALSHRVYENWGGTKEEWRDKLDEFFSERHLESLYPMAGALRGITALKKKGHELYIITGRGEGDIPATEQWIEKHFPRVFAGVHYCNAITRPDGRGQRSKGEICKENGIEIMIDDLPSFTNECIEAGIKVLLFNQPWNQGDLLPGVERVYSWEDIIEKLNS